MMRRTRTASLPAAVLGAILAACGPAEDQPPDVASTARLVGGTVDGTLHSNVGTLVAPFPGRTDPLGSRCSGTLVAPKVFLTAGHCGRRILDWSLGREEWGVSFEPAYVRGVTPIRRGILYIHPSYDPATGDNDAAVILLDEPVEDIAPAPIAGNRVLEKLPPDAIGVSRFVVVGYGSIAQLPAEGRGTRRWTEMVFLGLAGRDLWLDVDSWVALGMTSPGVGAGGPGDSGGPVFDGDTVVALVQWGDPSDPENVISYGRRIDVKPVREFVKAFIDGRSYDPRSDL